MRIVVDLQGAQTGSAKRGIGRYSRELTKGLLRHRAAHTVIIALNGLFPETIPSIRASLDGLLPQENIVVWDAAGPVSHGENVNFWRRKASELIRESFLASLEPDLLLVTSLFEGFNENAVSTVGSLTSTIPTAVILYDLIPLRYPQQYLAHKSTANWYSEKIENFRRADLWLAISEHARRECIELLGLPESRIINISTAADDRFRPVAIAPERASRLREALGITRRFILTTGGGEARKNLERLIDAFSRLPDSLNERYQLVVFGCTKDDDKLLLKSWRAKYNLRADQVILTDHLPDDQLVALYNLCELFVFPSWHEGFGLPALEAMQCGTPTIAAGTSSLPEVIGRTEALFDPYSADDIASKIIEILTDETCRHALAEHGRLQARKFSWDITARTALSAMEESAKQREVRPQSAKQREVRPRFSRRENYLTLIERIGKIPQTMAASTEGDLAACAIAITDNQEKTARFLRPVQLPQRLTWRIEGPFDSSYSLALLNRETARALDRLGHRVALHSTEGPGDFSPSEAFLGANPDLARFHAESAVVPPEKSDVVSRNLYPPRVSDMKGGLNLVHHYAWEESGFPSEWAENFSMHLDGVTCLSNHVRKILIDHGVRSRLSVSGCGVDHWERIAPDPDFKVEGKQFRFLHVSSCFPRKGADLLLKAYGRTFTAKDDVTLVIKTFPNPHNEIHKWLADFKTGRDDFPNVLVIENDLTDAQLKALYQQCHALAAPSKAEGFGLPIAEAMLSGLPVITTAWGGQLDFCNEQTAWLLDFDFEQAQSHFELFDSVWACPRLEELGATMRQVYELPVTERRKRAEFGRTRLLEKFRWSNVAERLVYAARSCAEPSPRSRPRTGWVTTWNTRCGIATYSAHLLGNMASNVTILAPSNQELVQGDEENVLRCWTVSSDSLENLGKAIRDEDFEVVFIQFNYVFFPFMAFERLLNEVLDEGRVVVVTLHSTSDEPQKKLESLREPLSRCARILVHSLKDLNRLKAIGLVDNVALFPHGVLDYQPTQLKQPPAPRNSFTIASYGFFLPNKGLLELIEALSLLRAGGKRVLLRMINAEYPIPLSGELISQAKSLVSAKGLQSIVEIETTFLSDRESLARLSQADLIVFPYQKTGESASGAARYGLAAGKPVAVTPLPIFDDISPAVFRLPGCSAQEIAQGVGLLMNEMHNNTDAYKRVMHDAARWRASHHYSSLGGRLDGMLGALMRVSRDREQ